MEKNIHKRICQDCMAKTCPVNGQVLRGTGVKIRNLTPVPWKSGDDELWEKGKVLCPDATMPTLWSKARETCRNKKAHEAVENGALLVRDEG
jgi:hypothetical protein